MIRKILPLLSLLIILKLNVSSQELNIWDTMFVETLKSNKDYIKNFNPLKFDSKSLRNCILDVLNLARKTNKNASDELSFNNILDSASKRQSEFMAKIEQKTLENRGVFSSTQRRVEHYGGTKFVDEVVGKVKTARADEFYSYLNVVTDLLLPILNNPKQSTILLDHKWTFVGISFDFDENNKNIYVSIVVGNLKSLNPTGKQIENLTVPITTKKYGLSAYDSKKCKKCDEFRNIEKLHSCLKIKDGKIYFEHPDIKNLKKLINRPEDGLAVDIVTKDQFKCGRDNILDNDRVNRGFLTKPIYFEKLLKNNEVTTKKSKNISVFIADMPKNLNGEYEMSLLIIKDGSVCRSIPKIYIENNKEKYNNRLSFEADTSSIVCKPYNLILEKAVFEFNIPFEVNKSDYKLEDLEPFFKALDEPKFFIDSLNVIAYTSMEGNDKKNIELQKKRAENIAKVIKQKQIKNIPYKISVSSSYKYFIEDVKNTQYYGMAGLTEPEVKQQLKGSILKDLEPILSKHRFAKITINVTYDISKKYEQSFLVNKFNKYINSNDLANAFSVQKYIISQVMTGRYNSKELLEMKIPNQDKKYIPFLINMLYIQNQIKEEITPEMEEQMKIYSQIDPQNEYAFYNKTISDASKTDLTNESNVKDIQSRIDNMYSFKKISKNLLDNLNIEYQFKVLNATDTSDNIQLIALNEAAYNKIKQVVSKSEKIYWKNAYRMVSVLINNGDFASAIFIMKLYIDDKNISNDFLFTYLTLLSHKEDFYLTPSFTKIVNKCLEIDKPRLCSLLKKFSIQVLENTDVKKVYCKDCK